MLRPCVLFVMSAKPMSTFISLILGVVNKMIWTPNKPVIDREKCKNTCFDTIFKGGYPEM